METLPSAQGRSEPRKMKDEKLYGVYRMVAIQKVNYLGLFKVSLDFPNGKSTLKGSDVHC